MAAASSLRSLAWLCVAAGAAAYAPAPLSAFHRTRPSPARSGALAMLERRMALPSGSLVALATPMLESGEVDIPKLREVLRWHKAEGTDGVVILGTTGEASVLTEEEKQEVDDKDGGLQ